jgi:hypothetical protein
MRAWKALLPISMALVASQALAEPWVKIATDRAGHTLSIDMDVRKGIDGLVYFSDSFDDADTYFDNAADCRRRVTYITGESGDEASDWRDHGQPVKAGSIAEAELKMVCTKAGSGPLPGTWVGVGFGQSIDRDGIRRGSDGLIHFTTYGDVFHLTSSDAADCQQRLIYFGEAPGWRDRGRPVGPGSFAEAELNYVCANVPQRRTRS